MKLIKSALWRTFSLKAEKYSSDICFIPQKSLAGLQSQWEILAPDHTGL